MARPQRYRRRFWLESVLSAASALMLLVTLAWREWIEVVFRVDPDGGNGSAEWLVVALLAATTVVSALAARADWRRLATSN